MIYMYLCAARQIGFTDGSECPELSKLAYEYLKQGKVCEEKIYEYFISQPEADLLYGKLLEEFDRCILSYFAYHWSQASDMITQVNFTSFYTNLIQSFVFHISNITYMTTVYAPSVS